jgi:diguanylate cyclase (GGDEF)-like protein/PAS domain S-box-containing protein
VDSATSEERMSFERTILERAAEGLCVCRAVEEFPFVRFTIWNQRMTEITGYSMEEINRLGWYQSLYLDREVQERAIARMAAMRIGEDLIGEQWEITRKDGERCFLRISTSLLETDDGTTYSLGQMEDVTHQRQTEEALKESEERFRNLMEHVPGISVQGYDTEGTVFYWNKASEEVYGYAPEEALGKNLADLIIPTELRSLFLDCLQVGKGLQKSGEFMPPGEIDLLHKDGHLVPIYSIHTSVCVEGRDPLLFCLDVDLSDRKRVEDALRASEGQLKKAQRIGKVASWEKDLLTETDVWSDEFFRLLGYEVGAIEPSYPLVLSHVHPGDRGSVDASFGTFLKGSGPLDIEFRYADSHGKPGFAHMQMEVELDQTKTPTSIFGTFQDITERKRDEKELVRLATTDFLTGLFNRRHFMELAEREFPRAKRYGDELSLIMLDADKFKEVNDTYGHNVGDFVLKSLASIGLSMLRDVDVFGRIGGEEFAVLLPSTPLERAMHVAEKLRTAITGAVVPMEQGELRVTVSLGVTSLRPDTKDVDMMLKEADMALYSAKEKGRNQVKKFIPAG